MKGEPLHGLESHFGFAGRCSSIGRVALRSVHTFVGPFFNECSDCRYGVHDTKDVAGGFDSHSRCDQASRLVKGQAAMRLRCIASSGFATVPTARVEYIFAMEGSAEKRAVNVYANTSSVLLGRRS